MHHLCQGALRSKPSPRPPLPPQRFRASLTPHTAVSRSTRTPPRPTCDQGLHVQRLHAGALRALLLHRRHAQGHAGAFVLQHHAGGVGWGEKRGGDG